MFRSLVIFGLAVGCSFPAKAACVSRPIGMTEKAYTSTLFTRMKSLGVRSISKASSHDGRDGYVMSGIKTSLFITPQSDLIKDIGFVLSEPADSVDLEKMVSAAAFTLAQLSSTPEQGIKDRLYTVIAKTSDSTIEFFDGSAAIIAKPSGGTVIKVSLTSCSP